MTQSKPGKLYGNKAMITVNDEYVLNKYKELFNKDNLSKNKGWFYTLRQSQDVLDTYVTEEQPSIHDIKYQYFLAQVESAQINLDIYIREEELIYIETHNAIELAFNQAYPELKESLPYSMMLSLYEEYYNIDEKSTIEIAAADRGIDYKTNDADSILKNFYLREVVIRTNLINIVNKIELLYNP